MKTPYELSFSLPNRWPLVLCSVSLFIGLSACSANQAYSSFQAEKRISCYSLPPENYDACMKDANKSYEEYKQELEEYEQQLKDEKKNSVE